MLRLILRRLASLVPLLLIVSVVIFSLVLLVPGDPATAVLGDTATPEQIAAVREELGLDRPVVVRYLSWLGHVVRGDLGTSLFTSFGVADAIVSRLPVTLSLVGIALALAVLIGIPTGVVAAYRHGTVWDRLLTIGTSAGVAIPNFWLGLVLILFVGLKLKWLPPTGYVGITENPAQWLRHVILPAVTLAAAGAAEISRQMRASMVDVLQQDYIRTIRAKGLGTREVVVKHALKNSMIPVVTVTGLQISRLFGLSVIVEQIFDMKGVGSLAIEAVFKRDVPMIQGIVLLVTAIVVVANLLVDVSYGYFNPKVREA